MGDTLVNKVAQSGLITLNLEHWLPAREEMAELDISQFLFNGLLLKEKDFRATLKEFDWTVFDGKYVAVHCSTKAIVPHWAYMLVGSYLAPHVKAQGYGTLHDVETQLLLQHIEYLDIDPYADERVIIKGCGDRKVSVAVYQAITAKLKPIVKSLMYGEPCSTVPIFKQPRKK